MPTWRAYLSKLSKEEFKQSQYFKAYDNLLRNGELNNRLEKEQLKLVFYIHYSLKPFIDCFNDYSNNVVIADFDHYDVQTLLKESKLLITDYSSIFFDFAYMHKPLLYYQFDEGDFYSKHYKRSYFDHRRDGFGEVINSEEYLVNTIFKNFDNNFKLEKIYEDKINNFFPLYDSNNSKRIFDAIINKLIVNRKYKKPSSKPTYLIFTGDDYGRNDESTLGINEAFKKGYIQQTSFMVNRNEDCYKYIDNSLKDRFVFHFNILEGNRTYHDDGEWFYFVEENGIAKRMVNKKTFLKLNPKDKEIIKEEIDNQIKLYKDLGYSCISFDSHGHMHNRMPIAKMLISACEENGFKVARIPMNLRRSHLLFDITYKRYINHLYRRSFITTDFFVLVMI